MKCEFNLFNNKKNKFNLFDLIGRGVELFDYEWIIGYYYNSKNN